MRTFAFTQIKLTSNNTFSERQEPCLLAAHVEGTSLFIHITATYALQSVAVLNQCIEIIDRRTITLSLRMKIE